MKKQMKRLSLAVIAIVMLLSTSMVAFAANGSALKLLRATNARNKAVKSCVIYTTSEDVIDESSNPTSMTLNVEAKTDPKGVNDGKYVVLSADNKIASVEKLSKGTSDGSDYQIKISAGSKAGKTTVTLTDPNNMKKQYKINVTVKPLTDDITFGNSVTSNADVNRMYIAAGGKLSMGTVSANNPKAKFSYTIASQKALVNGDYVEVAGGNKKSAIVSVTGKGVVTGLKPGKAEIIVRALDQKSGKQKTGYSEKVTVFVSGEKTVSMNVIAADGSNMAVKRVNSAYTLQLKTNETSEFHTYDGLLIDVVKDGTTDGTDDETDNGILYTSSKPAVAKVDKTGKITGVSNGTAKITISPADGSTKKIKKMVITVKVTTDIESKYIKLNKSGLTLGVGKSSALGVKVDKKVSGNSKKLTYRFADDDSAAAAAACGMTLNAKSGKVSVSKTGNAAKGIKIVAESVQNAPDGEKASRTVSVDVICPVKVLKASVPVYKGSEPTYNQNKNKTTTLYLNKMVDEQSTYDGDERFDLGTVEGYDMTDYEEGRSFNRCKIRLDVMDVKNQAVNADKLLEETKLSFASSKPSVAKVDQWGNVTAVGKGKTVITVRANDGSKKKAKVTVQVVQKVDELSLANALGDDLCLAANKAQTLKSVVNVNAGLKSVTYRFDADSDMPGTVKCTSKGKFTMKNVVIPEGQNDVYLGKLTVTANDAAKFKYPVQKACTREFDVYASSGNDPIDESMIDLGSHDGLSIKKGEQSTDLTSLIHIDRHIIDRELVWKTGSSKVLTIDKKFGTIVGKNVGTTVVTVQPKKNGSASSSAHVRVGASDAEYRANMDEQLKFALKAESYDWAGVKPTYVQDEETIYLDYVDGFEEAKADGTLKSSIKNIYEVFMDAFADASFRSASIVSDQDGTVYDLVRVGLNVKAYQNGKLISENVLSEKYKLADAFGLNKKVPADYAGTSYTISILKESKLVEGDIQYDTLEYTADYRLVFASNGDDAANGEAESGVFDMDAIVDARISDAISNIAYDKASTGISSVEYDAASNTAIVNIYNGSMKIADTAQSQARKNILDTCKSAFKELDKATVQLTAYGAELKDFSGVYSRERGDNTDVDGAVNRILDNMVEKLTQKNILELRMLDETSIKVLAKFSNTEDVIEYNIRFTLNADAMIDGTIYEAVCDNTSVSGYTGAISKLAFDSNDNIVTITLRNAGAELSDSEKASLMKVFDAFASKYDANKVTYVKTVIDTPDSLKPIHNSAEMKDFAEKLLSTSWKTFGDGDHIYVKNAYTNKADGSAETLNYVFEFVGSGKQADIKNEVSSLEDTTDGEDAASDNTVSAGDVETTVSDGDSESVITVGAEETAVSADAAGSVVPDVEAEITVSGGDVETTVSVSGGDAEATVSGGNVQ